MWLSYNAGNLVGCRMAVRGSLAARGERKCGSENCMVFYWLLCRRIGMVRMMNEELN